MLLFSFSLRYASKKNSFSFFFHYATNTQHNYFYVLVYNQRRKKIEKKKKMSHVYLSPLNTPPQVYYTHSIRDKRRNHLLIAQERIVCDNIQVPTIQPIYLLMWLFLFKYYHFFPPFFMIIMKKKKSVKRVMHFLCDTHLSIHSFPPLIIITIRFTFILI